LASVCGGSGSFYRIFRKLIIYKNTQRNWRQLTEVFTIRLSGLARACHGPRLTLLFNLFP
jgi:hypothetical protein